MIDGAVLTGGERETRWSYQELLRAAGAVLDRDAAGQASIVEVDDGFLLRRERVRHTSEDLAVTHVPRDVLRAYGLQHRQMRPPPVARRTTLWRDFTDSYQDFFRALGYELDAVGARNIVVDVLSNGLLLGYEQDLADGSGCRMRHAELRKSDIEEVLNEAVRRRKVGSGGPPEDAAETGTVKLTRPAWTPVRDGIEYQQVLRAVGAILDRNAARRICVMEAPEGMVMRYESQGDDRLIWSEIGDDQLEAEAARLRQVPLFGVRKPGPYEDLFRALGFELERDKASGILISEGTDELTISYTYLDPRTSFARDKRMLTMSRGAQEELLQRARDRQKPPPKPRRLPFRK